MPDNRRIIRTITSGFPQFVQKVDVYDSVIDHIQENHHEEFERFDQIISTVEGSATHIYESKTNETAIVLVNENVTSAGGDPLRVPIKVYTDGSGIMSTAYFADNKSHGKLIWSDKGGAIKAAFIAKRMRERRDDER